jgi:hypothetical protein
MEISTQGTTMTITQDQVKELFEYCDGELYRKVKTNRNIKIGAKAGYLNKSGYVITSINGKLYFNHRIIFLMFHGYLPEFIDHIDNNPLNNQIENLREATSTQNQYNRLIQKNNTSGVKGVSWNTQKQKWHVQLRINNKLKYFGRYYDLEVAKFVAETMRYKYHGAFANHGKVA